MKLDIEKLVNNALQSLVDKGWNIDYSIETEDDVVILELESLRFFFCESGKTNSNIIVSNAFFDDIVFVENLSSFIHGLAHATCLQSNKS